LTTAFAVTCVAAAVAGAGAGAAVDFDGDDGPVFTALPPSISNAAAVSVAAATTAVEVPPLFHSLRYTTMP
jgi:hypothetical protein